MQLIWSVDQAQNLALRIECLMKARTPPKVHVNPRFDLGDRSSSSKVESRTAGVQSKEAEPKKTDVIGNEIARYIRCFKCNEIGNRSNKCPR